MMVRQRAFILRSGREAGIQIAPQRSPTAAAAESIILANLGEMPWMNLISTGERVKNGRVPHLGRVGTLDSRVQRLKAVLTKLDCCGD
jgi:hypothetical protein